MNQVQSFKAAQAYGQVAVQGRAEDASPHRIIQMLMESALQKIMLAKGHMQKKQITEKGEQIGWAISIIEGMRASLDREHGGEIAVNLASLYEYMKVTLLEANLHNDERRLDEVASLLAQVKSGWDALPAQLAKQGK
jgi:flagellar protein FliS